MKNIKPVKVTKANLGHISKELETECARGSNGRQLTGEEIKARCDGLHAYCQLSPEKGGYAYAGAKAMMLEKIRRAQSKLENAEMTQQNTELADIAKDQDEDIQKVIELMAKIKNKNNNASGIISDQSKALETQRNVQFCMSEEAIVMNASMQAETEALVATEQKHN